MTPTRLSWWLLLVPACSSPPPPTVDVPGASATVDPGAPPAPKTQDMTPLALSSDDKEEMTLALNTWLDGLGQTLKLALSGATLAYDANSKAHRIEHDGWQIFIAFKGEAKEASAKDFAERFSYWGFDRAPVPITRDGWTFRLQTPSSSSSDGFEVLSLADGVMRVRIRGEFFALRGDRAAEGECATPADAATPDACFIQLERRMPFELVLDAIVP